MHAAFFEKPPKGGNWTPAFYRARRTLSRNTRTNRTAADLCRRRGSRAEKREPPAQGRRFEQQGTQQDQASPIRNKNGYAA
jgi:hypothetical protein